MPRILLIGQGPTAITALESLVERFEVVGVVRSTIAEGDAVVRLARASGVKVYLDTSMAAIGRLVDSLRPDCVVVSSYDRIFAPALVARCRFVNVHYADLPRYRGRATVNWAVINGEPYTAITIHELAPQLDGGAILFQERVPIGPDDSVACLYDRLNAIQRSALGRTVEAFLDGYCGQPQAETESTYSCTRLPRDGEIDWSRPTREVHALVRALVAPFPGAFTHIAGERLTIWRATPVADAPAYVGRVPGRVVGVSRSNGWVDVLTGDGVLRLLEVQRDGADRVTAATVIRSVKATLGLRSIELLERIRLLEERIAQLTNTVEGLVHDRRQADSHYGWSGTDRIAYRGPVGRPPSR
jgi:methionyl-tRNA formyltransferase